MEIIVDEQALSEQLDRMITGYCVSQAIYVAAKLGIAYRLAHGPKNTDELVRDLGVHSRSLYRLLRALASVGIFVEDADQRFSLTPLADLLRSDAPGSQRATVLMMVGQFYHAWGGLVESIQTGRPYFEAIHGQPFFSYLAENPDEAQVFDDAMTARNDRKTKAMLEVYDLSGIKVLADIGGGNGSTLLTVLDRHPALQGILFDRSDVIERARLGIERAGLSNRCRLQSGSFLENVPPGADAYLLRHILHNWDDEHAVIILKRVHEAMGDGAKLLVVERVIPRGNDPMMFGKLMDLNMLVLLGGVERTEQEFRRLFDLAGFVLTGILPTNAEVSVIAGARI